MIEKADDRTQHTADHLLGRPSSQFRKIQVFAVVSFWSLYLLKYAIAIGFCVDVH